MEFRTLLETRASVRSFLPDPIPEEKLKHILECARLAPSACNRQPWEFLVIQTPEVLARVHAAYSRPWFAEAPAVVVVKGRISEAWVRKDGYCSIETDLAIAMTTLIYAAADEGIGSCWIGAFDERLLREALLLKEEDRVFGMTPLGFISPAFTVNPKTRKGLEEVVRFL